MLDKTSSSLGSSWDSVVSTAGEAAEEEADATAEALQQQRYAVSRHDPDRTYRREELIASWRSVRREREEALGRRPVLVDADTYRDYLGRRRPGGGGGGGGVVRSCSERVTAAADRPRVRRRVKRTCSVLYRYDSSSERVVKEYKYLRQQPPPPPPSPPARCCSEPPSPPPPQPQPPPPPPTTTRRQKAKRSLTAVLKKSFFNLFAAVES